MFYHLTSLGKELRIDGLECLLINQPTGTLLLKRGRKKLYIYIRIIQVYIKHNNSGKAIKTASAAGSQTYILEPSIERLKLLPGELGLSLQLVQPLRLVTHR